MNARWQLSRPASLHVREWDDGGVVYDAFSGDTHLLDLLGLELLDLLRQRAWDVAELAAELSATMPDELSPDDLPPMLRAKMEQLARLDLVVPS